MDKNEILNTVNKLLKLVEQDTKEAEKVKVKSVNERYLDFLDEAQDLGCDSNNGYAYLSTSKVLNYAKGLAKKHGFYIEMEPCIAVLKIILRNREDASVMQGISLCFKSQHEDVRKMGAEITILRRYGLMLLLGIVSKVDDDEGILDDKKPVFVSNKVAPEKEIIPEKEVAVSEPEVKKERKRKAAPMAKEVQEVTITSVEDTEAEEIIPQLDPDSVKAPEPVVEQALTLEQLIKTFNEVKERNLLHKLQNEQIEFFEDVVLGKEPFEAYKMKAPHRFLIEKILGE